jgi:hypothetical protein
MEQSRRSMANTSRQEMSHSIVDVEGDGIERAKEGFRRVFEKASSKNSSYGYMKLG